MVIESKRIAKVAEAGGREKENAQLLTCYRRFSKQEKDGEPIWKLCSVLPLPLFQTLSPFLEKDLAAKKSNRVWMID